MRKIKLYTIIAILEILCAACNNGIFVEPLPDIPQEIYLDGFEDAKIITIQKKGLKNVKLGDNYGLNWQPSTTYYDKEGNELHNLSKIDDVSKILYVCKMFAVEFNIRGDEVEIVSLDNAYTDPVEMWVCLDYGYSVKYMDIKIGVGHPLEIKQFNHFIDEYIVETETVRAYKEKITNATEQAVKATLFPYKDSLSKLILTPADVDYWSSRATGTVHVPIYHGGQWSQYDTEDVDATIGNTTAFISLTVDVDEKVYIEIPANSVATATVYVTYAKLKTGYRAEVGFPNIAIDWLVGGTLEEMQPIAYKLDVSILDI